MPIMKSLISFVVLPLSLFAPVAASSQVTEPGFQSLFNGRDLANWAGSSEHWSVQEGAVTGRTTVERPLEANTFLIWQGGEVADFELRAEFRLTGDTANSGIQYRSRVIDPEQWIVGGYQADMDAANRYTGILYEERGRGILVEPGQRMRIGKLNAAGKPELTAVGPAEDAAAIKDAVHVGDWNEMVVVAKGNHLRHYVNGRLTAEVFDTDESKAASSGVLALQLHKGPPMTVEFKNIRLKRLR